jgi:hypothetical protein
MTMILFQNQGIGKWEGLYAPTGSVLENAKCQTPSPQIIPIFDIKTFKNPALVWRLVFGVWRFDF